MKKHIVICDILWYIVLILFFAEYIYPVFPTGNHVVYLALLMSIMSILIQRLNYLRKKEQEK